MKKVVIESPYGSPDPDIVMRNVKYARKCVAHSLEIGEAPIASHILYTQEEILEDAIEEERYIGINAGLAWLDVADSHVFYIDHGISEGMFKALQITLQRNHAYFTGGERMNGSMCNYIQLEFRKIL